MTPLIAYVIGAVSGLSMPYIHRLIVGRRETRNGQAWEQLSRYIREQDDQDKSRDRERRW